MSWCSFSVCVCVFLFCLDFLFSSLFLFIITNFFGACCVSQPLPSLPLHHVLEIKEKKREREREQGFFFSSWVLLIELAKEKNVKSYRPCSELSSTGFFFFLGIVMLKLNELKPLLNLPQSRLHQPSGCDLGALALWCQIWKFSLPLKNEQKHKNKLPLISCITMLATLS